MKPFARPRHSRSPYAGTASPSPTLSFVRRYGRGHSANPCEPAPAELEPYESASFPAAPAGSFRGRSPHPFPELQCPACELRTQMDEYDAVRIEGKAHIHCPNCDANLGLSERALRHAA